VENPLVLGHESAGVITGVGAAVTNLKTGDRVAIEPGFPCRTCDFCRSGRYNLCDFMRFAATPPIDGTLCTYYTVPEDFAYKLPDTVSMTEGALIEPLSIAVHTVKLAQVAMGHNVLVMGAGPIGLLCCTVARSFGASFVACADVADNRVRFAKEYAAHESYLMKAISPQENAREITSLFGIEQGFDAVIDATGATPAISCGIHALRKGAVFVQAGLGASEIPFPIEQICSKEAVFKGTFRYGAGDYKLAVELLRSRKVSVDTLITDTYSFAHAEQAFNNVVGRNGIKTIILGPGVNLDDDILTC